MKSNSFSRFDLLICSKNKSQLKILWPVWRHCLTLFSSPLSNKPRVPYNRRIVKMKQERTRRGRHLSRPIFSLYLFLATHSFGMLKGIHDTNLDSDCVKHKVRKVFLCVHRNNAVCVHTFQILFFAWRKSRIDLYNINIYQISWKLLAPTSFTLPIQGHWRNLYSHHILMVIWYLIAWKYKLFNDSAYSYDLRQKKQHIKHCILKFVIPSKRSLEHVYKRFCNFQQY